MATESNVRRTSGVRTYRGRTLEEILPQIRAELGSDAIILREREGLVGGVGGFFAQRFIEVDARRGDGQSIDIYDDSPEDDLRTPPPGAPDGPEVTERKAILPPEPVQLRSAPPVVPDGPIDLSSRRPAPVEEPVERPQPRPFVPRSVERERPEVEPPAPASRRFETGVFMERLREASADLADEPTVEQPAPQPPAAEQPAPELPAREQRTAQRPKPERKPRADRGERPKPATRSKPASQNKTRAKPERSRPATKGEPPAAAASAPPAAAPTQPAAPPTQPTAAPTQPAAAPTQPAAEPIAQNPYDQIRHRPRSLSAGLPTGEPQPPAPEPSAHSTASAVPVPSRRTPPASVEIPGRSRSEDGLLHALGRLLGGRFRSSSVPRATPARPLDPVAATELATELSTHGASQAWTSQLISAAGAHGSPLAGSLRAAAEAEVARRIVPAPPLPATGAAVGLIGAGGSGKTRCTAALASAYRRGSTLGVTVIALDNPDGARELNRLLADDGVPVLSLSGERAARAIEQARDGGFVIVDTPTATPTDADAVAALGATLEPLRLDATYVALPATLGPQAARRALAGFGQLRPSAAAITHTDETDQLAVVMEIAISHRIPLAFLHAGTDHRTALSAIDAPAIAQQLLTS